MTDRIHLQQPRRKTTRQNVYAHNVQSLTALVSEPHVHLTVHQFDTCPSQSHH